MKKTSAPRPFALQKAFTPFIAIFAAIVLTGAQSAHTRKEDLERCKQAAETQRKASSIGQGQNVEPEFEYVVQCMKTKGYMRVEDTAGICDFTLLAQCFEHLE